MSRRGLLSAAGLTAALAGAGLAGGCDLDPSSSSAPRASASPDPDAPVLTAARTELSGLIARLSASSGTAALVACHRAQLAALGGRPRPVTHRSRPLTPAATVVRERRAVARFTHWASTCADGDLARVLASVAAGIRMQPVLRETP
jgi:hypothetical protein